MVSQAAAAALLWLQFLPHSVLGRPLRVIGDILSGSGQAFLEPLAEAFEVKYGIKVEYPYANTEDATTEVQKTRTIDDVSEGRADVIAVDGIYIWELADMLEAVHVSEVPEDLRQAIPAETLLRFQTGNGQQSALPLYEDYGMLYYRTDLLKQYGFSPPGPEGWTWDEVEEIARVVQEGEMTQNLKGSFTFDGFAWPGSAFEGLTCFALEVLASEGAGDIIKPNGEVDFSNNPGAIRGLQRMMGWLRSDNHSKSYAPVSPLGVLSMVETDVRRRFCEDGRAMFARGWADTATHCNSQGMAGLFGVVRNPGAKRASGVGTWGGVGLAVVKNSPYAEAARLFIEMAATQRFQMLQSVTTGMVSPRTDVAGDNESCSGISRDSCRVKLRDILPGSHVRLPGSHQEQNAVTIIVSAPSDHCPQVEHISTMCDLNFTGYSIDRPAAVVGNNYAQVSTALYSAVSNILKQDAKDEVMKLFMQAAECRMIKNTAGSDTFTPLRLSPHSETECVRAETRCKDGQHLNKHGVCEACRVLIGSYCVPMPLYMLALPTFLAIALVINVYMIRVRAWADSAWMIDAGELDFETPGEVLAQGTFGRVLRAEYRGTCVAVKRVMPPGGVVAFPAFGPIEEAAVAWDRHVDRSRTRNSSSLSYVKGCSRKTISTPGNAEDGDLESGLPCSTARSQPSPSPKGDEMGPIRSWSRSRHRPSRKSTRLASTAPAHMAQLRLDFIHEMRVLSKLRHPCVLTLMGAVISNKCEPMLVMEFMQHGSLYDLLRNETIEIEGELLLPILCDVSSGLRFLHATRPPVVHGDLKAKHVLVDSKFRAKVGDFGFSQKQKLKAVTGPQLWSSPEVLQGEPKTPASDVYAYGVLLTEAYTRYHPYPGEDPAAVVAEVADPAQDKRPDVPSHCSPDVGSLMRDCWRANAALRPTASELDRRMRAMAPSEADTGIIGRRISRRSREQRRTYDLLCDVFPPHVAEALRDGRTVEPESKEVVTIFFSDIVGFTDISSTLEPQKVSDMLDRLYSKFDALSRELQVFKVETIGDAYMAVSNLVEDQSSDHAKRIALFARLAIEAANSTEIDVDDPGKGFVSIRVGFHSGPVVANVVGTRNMRYCLFGDTVNTAARMESNSAPNCIHCSKVAAEFLRKQAPEISMRCRGSVPIKGKGEMTTFWVEKD